MPGKINIKKYCNLKKRKEKKTFVQYVINILLIIHFEVRCVHVAYVINKTELILLKVIITHFGLLLPSGSQV